MTSRVKPFQQYPRYNISAVTPPSQHIVSDNEAMIQSNTNLITSSA